ncbi:hypothetical protein B4U79_14431, partial [Dinothrombium tinctorium]
RLAIDMKSILLVAIIKTFLFTIVICGMVKVKIYDHRAEHDPIELYGNGPWKYRGHGYGIEYQYLPDGSYERQRGYGFIKLLGREFCKPNSLICRPSDPNFFDKLFSYNRGEPFWGQPAAEDVVTEAASASRRSSTTISLLRPT